MSKKTVMISGVSVLLALLIVLTATGKKANSASDVPKEIFVYFEETNEIKRVDYADFLADSVYTLLEDLNIDAIDDETIKAVATAINSRLIYKMNKTHSADADIGTSGSFKNYGADLSVSSTNVHTTSADDRIKSIARARVSSLLTYGGEPANVPVCLISNGRTDAAPPYSPSIELPCDVNAEGFKSVWSYTPDEVTSALYSSGELPSRCKDWFGNFSYSDTGTLISVSFAGRKISGSELRNALGLRSTAVTVAYLEDKFIFTCLGLGENRGMSVYAADWYAKEGSSAEEILKMFYPDCRQEKLR